MSLLEPFLLFLIKPRAPTTTGITDVFMCHFVFLVLITMSGQLALIILSVFCKVIPEDINPSGEKKLPLARRELVNNFFFKVA